MRILGIKLKYDLERAISPTGGKSKTFNILGSYIRHLDAVVETRRRDRLLGLCVRLLWIMRPTTRQPEFAAGFRFN